MHESGVKTEDILQAGTQQTTTPKIRDWRLEMSESQRRPVRLWLWSGAVLVFLMLVIGGITRLTQSGLSMVNWRPLMGAIPPLNHAQWMEVFNQYKQFPEYQQLNTGMTLSEFKFIFFWEYLHRLIGRIIGVVFLLPFAWFAIRGYFNKPLFKRVLVVFGLGIMQGLMGWIMVKSGLVNRPYVSHFRLAAHLMLAFTIFAFCVWYARDLALRPNQTSVASSVLRSLRKWVWWIGGLLLLQVIWGAFVAGLKAGHMFNTFPTMLGRWIPVQLWDLSPGWINPFENPVTVQWIHRIIGTVLGLTIIMMWIRSITSDLDRKTTFLSSVLLGAVLVQYLLGVLTLLHNVPVVLGVMHQAMAMILWGCWLVFLHHLTAEIYKKRISIRA